MIRVFGLTGGIGSGKTTVGRRFEERGVGMVDADELSREVVRPGSEGLAAIRERFGDEVIGGDGALDRAALARLVFGDDGAMAALEAITHPRIRTLARERFAALEREGALLGCYVVPLLYERGLESEYSPVVVVNATPEQQIERTRLRDSAPEEAVEARMRAQLPLSDKVERADFVIDNCGAIEDALDQADQVLDAICLESGLDPARFPRNRHP